MTAGMAGAVFGCQGGGDRPTASAPAGAPAGAMAAKVAQYTTVRLTADLRGLVPGWVNP